VVSPDGRGAPCAVVGAGHIPGLDEALSRLDLLRSDGPSPLAFTFQDPYDAPIVRAARH
jgi:hypothetical protein